MNRWGNVRFESKDYKNDWKGGGLSDGVYYYTLKNEELGNVKTGFVHVFN